MAQPVARIMISLLLFIIFMTGLSSALTDDKKEDDNTWLHLCEMYHPHQVNGTNSIVMNAVVSETGCQLRCFVLQSSSHEHRDFLDKSVTHSHNLNDGIYCKRDHVCKSGFCVLELMTDNGLDGERKEKMGIIIVDVLDAYVPQKDTITPSDTYVKVVVKSPIDGNIPIGKTKIVWDTDHPVFNKTLKIEQVSITSTVFFEIFDKDVMGPDDYIAAVYAAIKTLLKQDRNHKEIRLFFQSQYYLKVKISWIAYE